MSKVSQIRLRILAHYQEVLFRLWYKVELGFYDSRSEIGDLALEMRDTYYKHESIFNVEYGAWREQEIAKKGKANGGT